MKLAQILTVMFFLFSVSLLAQEPTPVTQDPKPAVISEEKVVDLCSINSEIGLTVYSSGRIELRYVPEEAKPYQKGKLTPARDSKVQTISVRIVATCGSGTVIEWSRTYQKGKLVEQRDFRISLIGGITGIAVPEAQITTTNLMLNAEPIPISREVQLKKVQGRLLLSVVERLQQVCRERADYTEAERSTKPLSVDPILAEDVIAIFSAAQGDFYTTLPKKVVNAVEIKIEDRQPK